jgi:hypothetical protein
MAHNYRFCSSKLISLALVPAGKRIDWALLGPLDVPVVAGHRC